jgi:hypothetical protein
MGTFDTSIPRKLHPNLEFLLHELTSTHKIQPRSMLVSAWQNMFAIGCPFHCPFVAQDLNHIVAGEMTSEFRSKWLLWGRHFVHTVDAVHTGPATENNICSSMHFSKIAPGQWKKGDRRMVDHGDSGLLHYEDERWQVIRDVVAEGDDRISTIIRRFVRIHLSGGDSGGLPRHDPQKP